MSYFFCVFASILARRNNSTLFPIIFFYFPSFDISLGGHHLYTTRNKPTEIDMIQLSSFNLRLVFSERSQRSARRPWGVVYFWDNTSKALLQIAGAEIHIFFSFLRDGYKALVYSSSLYTVLSPPVHISFKLLYSKLLSRSTPTGTPSWEVPRHRNFFFFFLTSLKGKPTSVKIFLEKSSHLYSSFFFQSVYFFFEQQQPNRKCFQVCLVRLNSWGWKSDGRQKIVNVSQEETW
jgi:hypothetical protein